MATITKNLHGICNLQAYSSCFAANNNNIKKSIVPTIKHQIPKSNKFRCSFSRFSHDKFGSPKNLDNLDAFTLWSQVWDHFSPDKIKGLNTIALGDRFVDFTSDLLFDKVGRETLTVTVVILDEDERLEELQKLISKASSEGDTEKKANIVLDEVAPCMIKNADRWVSSRLVVAETTMESKQKLDHSENLNPDVVRLPQDTPDVRRSLEVATNLMEWFLKLCPPGVLGDFQAPNISECIEVKLELSMHGVISDKFKVIQTREDLIALLHHMIAYEGIKCATVSWDIAMVLKEKTKGLLQDYSHATY